MAVQSTEKATVRCALLGNLATSALTKIGRAVSIFCAAPVILASTISTLPPHENEKIIADALLENGSYGGMFIASKGGVEKSEAGISRDTSASTMKRHLNESLANLGINQVGLYYVYAPDGKTLIT